MRLARILLVLLSATVLTLTTASAQARPVLIFAAASLATVIDDLSGPVRQATGLSITASYAASSALARQIEQGAAADIFISADQDWMDYLLTRDLVTRDSISFVAGNRLVLVATARGGPRTLQVQRGMDLAGTLGSSRLAIADPDVVPAGRYARAALTSLGVWNSVASKLAPAENVRAALALVSTGQAPLGIVYSTDALAEEGVVVVGTFPEGSHPAIVYPGGLTRVAQPGARAVLAFMAGPAARVAFARHGFPAPAPPPR